MIGDFATNRLITSPFPAGTTPLTFYVRPGGDDNNGGQSAVDAFATLARALREIALYAVNRPTKVDITGMDISEEELLQLGGQSLGGIDGGYDLAELPPDYAGYRHQCQIVAEPELVLELDVTGSAADADTGLIELTVSNALVANQLVDTIAVGDGFGEYGAIVSHTAGAGPNTIQVATTTPFSLPVAAYEPGATIAYGDPADFFNQAIHLQALSDWGFQWIRFESNGPKSCAITVWPHAPVAFFGCVLEGLQVYGGAAIVTISACVIRNQTWAQDGAQIQLFQSVLRELLMLCHGSGVDGLNEMTACYLVDNSGAYGAGNVESRFTFAMFNCDVSGSTTDGIEARFGTSSCSDTAIHDNADDGANVINGATLYLLSVVGTANGGEGANIDDSGTVLTDGATTLTGAGGNVRLGAAGVLTWAAALGSRDAQTNAAVGSA
jgi:hypothetical protein